MDIQHLVDRLEDLIDEGRHVPMSKYTLIDEERALGIIDQMRISVPEQIETAARIISQRDRLIAQANEEASRIIEHARQKSGDMVNRDAIVVAAQHQSNHLINQARIEAEKIRDEADAYVLDVLRELEAHLLRTLTVVRNGINKVVQDREAKHAQAPVQHAPIVEQPAQTQPDTMPIMRREDVLVGRDGEQS